MYKKRDGTSGIRGQLYETKLISLIHFRTKFDDTIKDYNLATNVADIGTFDDICIRAKFKNKGGTKPVAVFIQAKHREGDKVQLTLNSKNDLAKWFSSYLSIRRLFKPSNKDVLFKGNFADIECLFIMYTTAKSDPNTTEYKGDFADKLNSLIGTGDKGLHPSHKEEDIVFLCEIIMKEQFVALAVHMAKFLTENKNDKDNNAPIMSMNDDLLLYHVILTQKVLDVSEIKCKYEEEEHRVASFKKTFFNNNEEFLLLFKETLSIEMLKKRKLKEVELNGLLTKLFIQPLDITVLSSLIGNVVIFNDKKLKLEFVNKSMSEDLKRRLEKVDVLQSTVHEAIERAANEMLTSRHFKVPAAFGNKDLTIRGKEDNAPSVYIASVVDKLKNLFVELTNASAPENIINIDESLGKEFLQLNAGLASTIGNILLSDVNTKYLKFTDNSELLGELAKRLHDEVKSAIPNVHDYRFQIKIKTFPKLTFDCDEDEDLGMLKNQVTELAEYFGDFVCKEEDSIMPMNDIVLRYHVLLTLKAVEVSKIQSLNEDDEHRLASFRHDFFESDEEFVVLFKKALCNKILKLKNLNENEIDLATGFSLSSRQFKVPAAFGNKDMTIKIKKSKTERRLDHLSLKISQLIAKSKADKIVTLDESLGDGLLKLYGGLAGIVGNILVSEENTKLMKFTDNWESLEELSKRLYIKLQSGIQNLHEYKFDVKVKKFPKLSFKRDEDDENLAKDFLKKLLFFTNQADEKGVETFLKYDIEYRQSLNVNNVRVTADAIYLQYHDAIQRWWMLKEAEYLTKQSKHYENALAQIVDKPLMTSISTMYMIKVKNNIDYTFNEKALNLKLLDQPPATIFVTESSVLTVAKMVQSLKKIDHFVFDLDYVLDLQEKDFITVSTELSKTNENKVIIVVCNDINRNCFKRLEGLAKVLDKKRIIFVVKEALVETIKCHFVQANNIVTDEECSLIQMSKESQDAILQNAKVIFQDVELTLNSIIDEESMAFVKGEVLNKIMNNEPIILGESNTNLNYEKVKHLYIDRRVNRVGMRVIRFDMLSLTPKYPVDGLRTLNDINNMALITAKSGVGKSTLLTHLSLKTKELNPKVWIITVNLLIHTKKFNRWQVNGTNIDYLETLKFFCELLSENQNKTNDLLFELEIMDGDVSLKSCTGDQRTIFELKMFLHYYNRKEIIFLFDGFDEICPMYADEVLTLLKAFKSYPRKHRMLITSRSYDRVVSNLERTFGESYEIQHFSRKEQDAYLLKFWKSTIKLGELSKEQYDNLCSFIEFMSGHYYRLDINNQKVEYERHQVLFLKVCVHFLIHYLKYEINVCPDFIIQTFNNFFTDCNDINIEFTKDFDSPLHLYLFADYFQNQMRDENIIPNRWNLDINAFTVYDAYIEKNLKKIHFQGKNKIDLYSPDMTIYENARAEFFAKHYKLGAYVVFYKDADKIFSHINLTEIKEIIDKIRDGTEKTGLIHSVANGFPNFIHMTFTEYFAVQYICDLLKTETAENKQKSIWDFILNVVFLKCRENVRNILDHKIKTDEALKAVVHEHQEIIFDLLLEQGKGVYTYYHDDFSKYLYLKVRTSFLPAMDDELTNFVRILYELKEELTKKYLEDPTKSKKSPLIRSYKTLKMKRIKFLFLIESKRKRCNFGNNSSESVVEGADNGAFTIPRIDKDAGIDHGPSRPIPPDNGIDLTDFQGE